MSVRSRRLNDCHQKNNQLRSRTDRFKALTVFSLVLLAVLGSVARADAGLSPKIVASIVESPHVIQLVGSSFPAHVKVEVTAGFSNPPVVSTTTTDFSGAFVAHIAIPNGFVGAVKLTARYSKLTPVPAALGKPFDPNSFWYQTIAHDVQLDPLSSAHASVLSEDLAKYWSGLNTKSYAPPIYLAAATTPRFDIALDYCNGPPSDPVWMAEKWAYHAGNVPVPPETQASAGEDGEVVIWSPSTDTVWEFWHFKKTSSGYQACWGGTIRNASKSNGMNEAPFGVAATRLSLLGGTVRASELAAGHIDHVMAIGIDRPRKDIYSWPSQGSDGTWDSPNAIMEGQRLRLDPSVNIDQLDLHPIGHIIAKAAQTYGFVVRDNSAGPIVVYGEDAMPYVRAGKPNPYVQAFDDDEGRYMKNFPWSKMQFLPKDYGK